MEMSVVREGGAAGQSYHPTGGGEVAGPSLPQHTTEPSSLAPQPCDAAAETSMNTSAGGDAGLPTAAPQHVTVPSVLRPHECARAAATFVNAPLGGDT